MQAPAEVLDDLPQVVDVIFDDPAVIPPETKSAARNMRLKISGAELDTLFEHQWESK